ncbi:MAG: hypothetical protein KKC76_18440 [Proteobacteria bacterium]|nr:hypothetical protein [Pseudomonadota bacterium]MBU4296684.1 hypothetical protein [Pseudomonadota bacterium]MCG2748477.1 hypothetical protein [Desulfobulbaceae bacterium]
MKYVDVTDGQCKDGGLAIMLILLLVAWFGERPVYAGPVIVVLLITMIRPVFFKPLAWLLFRVSAVLEKIASRVILTFIFVFMVTPVGICRKMLGHDPMRLKQWHVSHQSSFQDRKHKFTAADLEKQF